MMGAEGEGNDSASGNASRERVAAEDDGTRAEVIVVVSDER